MALLRECLGSVRAAHGESIPPPLPMRRRASATVRVGTPVLQGTRLPLPGLAPPTLTWTGFRGVKLAGDAWGDPQGPLVLLLHGFGQTRHIWSSIGRMLGEAGYYAIALDARGHGDSDWASNGDYSRDAMIRDVQCVVAALGHWRPVLMGSSMGAGVSLVAAGERHIDASALVLVDIAPRAELKALTAVKRFMRGAIDGFDSLQEVAEAHDRARPRGAPPCTLVSLVKNVRRDARGKYHWHLDPRLIRREPESDERRAESVRHLSLPTLLMRGGLTDVVSEQGVQEFLSLCPCGEFVDITEAASTSQIDRIHVLGRTALEFLQRMVPSADAPGCDPG